jgi:hypothetical protein
MDYFIPLIVIAIVIWSTVSKYKAQRKKQPGAAPLAGGWVSKLKTFLADVQRQIEEQAKHRTRDASEWDRLQDDSQTYRSAPDADEAVPGDRVLSEAHTQPAPQKITPVAPVRVQTSRSDQAQVAPGALRRRALPADKPSRAFVAASRADLRNALIWSEILGPPIALRDHRTGQIGRAADAVR